MTEKAAEENDGAEMKKRTFHVLTRFRCVVALRFNAMQEELGFP